MPGDKKNYLSPILRGTSLLLQIGSFALTFVPGGLFVQMGLALGAVLLGSVLGAAQSYLDNQPQTALGKGLFGTIAAAACIPLALTSNLGFNAAPPLLAIVLVAGLLSAAVSLYLDYRANNPKTSKAHSKHAESIYSKVPGSLKWVSIISSRLGIKADHSSKIMQNLIMIIDKQRHTHLHTSNESNKGHPTTTEIDNAYKILMEIQTKRLSPSSAPAAAKGSKKHKGKLGLDLTQPHDAMISKTPTNTGGSHHH